MSSFAPASSNLAPTAHPSSQVPKYLYRRGKNFYFKRRIPADVADRFAHVNGQVWKSLDTDNLGKARVYLAVEISEFDLTVAQLRRAKALESAQGIPGAQKDAPLTIVRSATSSSEKSAVQAKIDLSDATEVTSAKVFAVAPTSTAEPVSMTSATANQIPAKPKVIKKSTETEKAVSGTPSTAIKALIAPTMTHLFEDWKQKQTRKRTINTVHTAVMEFRTLHGPISVAELEKKHARAYRDCLIARSLSKRTVENRLGFLSTLMRHGMREMVEQLNFNPFEFIDVIGATGLRKPKDRRAYGVSELNSIFASRLYTEGYRPDGQASQCAKAARITSCGASRPG